MVCRWYHVVVDWGRQNGVLISLHVVVVPVILVRARVFFSSFDFSERNACRAVPFFTPEFQLLSLPFGERSPHEPNPIVLFVPLSRGSVTFEPTFQGGLFRLVSCLFITESDCDRDEVWVTSVFPLPY